MQSYILDIEEKKKKQVFLGANFSQFLKIKLWCFYLACYSLQQSSAGYFVNHSSKTPFSSNSAAAVKSIRYQQLDLVIASSAHG